MRLEVTPYRLQLTQLLKCLKSIGVQALLTSSSLALAGNVCRCFRRQSNVGIDAIYGGIIVGWHAHRAVFKTECLIGQLSMLCTAQMPEQHGQTLQDTT